MTFDWHGTKQRPYPGARFRRQDYTGGNFSSRLKAGDLEIWLDDLENGKFIAIIPINTTGSETNWKTFSKAIESVSGHHDVFVKFTKGSNRQLFVNYLRFISSR